MPRRKTPQPLYRLCVAYVAERIQSLCPPHDAVGSVLPPLVNEDLWDALKCFKHVNLLSLLHLLSHRLRRIEVRFDIRCPFALRLWPRMLLSRIAQNGKHIVELSLVQPPFIFVLKDESALVDALSKLPRLRRLTLCLRNVTDRVVVSIAEHCSELCELKLSGGHVTDESLCRLVACSQLRTLRFEVTTYPRITLASTLHLLRGLRHLDTLDIPFLTDALLMLPADCRLRLAEYTLRGVSYLLERTTALPHIVSVCPQLTRVNLNLTGQESIVALVQLRKLTELTLQVIPDSTEHFFRHQVEPVLCAVGPHLQKLAVSMHYVDVAAISWHCPSLIDLEVEDLRTLTVTDQPHAQPSMSFRHLQRLKFFLSRMSTVTPEQLFQILCSCDELVRVFLGFCELTDASLEVLVKSGTFGKLRELGLHEVCSISAVGLQALVMADSELASLTVCRCNSVRQDDVEDLWDHVADNNLDLLIRYKEM